MKSALRPILMVAFVIAMVFLMQRHLEEKKDMKVQEETIDPSSVIYSDIGAEDAPPEYEEGE